MRKNMSMLFGFASLTAITLFANTGKVDASTTAAKGNHSFKYESKSFRALKKEVSQGDIIDSLHSQSNNHIGLNLNKTQKVNMEVFDVRVSFDGANPSDRDTSISPSFLAKRPHQSAIG